LGIAWIAGFVSINNNFSFKEVMKYVLKQGYFEKNKIFYKYVI